MVPSDKIALTLGDIMQGEREKHGKTYLDVQRELRVKAAYIEAIENSDPSAFDTPGFMPGYVRSYARYLGLDPNMAWEAFCYESGLLSERDCDGPKVWSPPPRIHTDMMASYHPVKYRSKQNRLMAKRLGWGAMLLSINLAFILFVLNSTKPETLIAVSEHFFSSGWSNALYVLAIAVAGRKIMVGSAHAGALLLVFLVFVVPIAFAGIYFIRPVACLEGAYSFSDHLYFSYITYLSIGYGDITPVDGCRGVAAIEGIVGLVGLGVVTARYFVSAGKKQQN